MKKAVLLMAIVFFLGDVVFAQDDTGALGFGIVSESSKAQFTVGRNLRFNLFLDAGTKLYGPFHYGFEFQGDVKKIAQSNSDFSQTDVSLFGISSSDYVLLIQTSTVSVTTTLWDLDVSPRGYLSFELGNKVQIMGFAGLNYNWQTIDYDVRVKSGSWRHNGTTYVANTSNDGYSNSAALDGTWDVVAGARVSIAVFYVDYTRFLRANDSGNYSFNQYNKDRFGIGIDLRF